MKRRADLATFPVPLILERFDGFILPAGMSVIMNARSCLDLRVLTRSCLTIAS